MLLMFPTLSEIFASLTFLTCFVLVGSAINLILMQVAQAQGYEATRRMLPITHITTRIVLGAAFIDVVIVLTRTIRFVFS